MKATVGAPPVSVFAPVDQDAGMDAGVVDAADPDVPAPRGSGGDGVLVPSPGSACHARQYEPSTRTRVRAIMGLRRRARRHHGDGSGGVPGVMWRRQRITGEVRCALGLRHREAGP